MRCRQSSAGTDSRGRLWHFHHTIILSLHYPCCRLCPIISSHLSPLSKSSSSLTSTHYAWFAGAIRTPAQLTLNCLPRTGLPSELRVHCTHCLRAGSSLISILFGDETTLGRRMRDDRVDIEGSIARTIYYSSKYIIYHSLWDALKWLTGNHHSTYV